MILPLVLTLALVDGPTVTPPPESFYDRVDERHRAAARSFYTKHVDVGGMPIVASPEVADQALLRAHEIVSHLLAGRPDVLSAMVEKRMYLIIIGKDQVYTDMPEYRDHPDAAYMNERVRGTGGRPTSFGEENLLSLPLDRYDDESIAVHEFCHTIDGTMRSLDEAWRGRVVDVYRAALAKGLYANAYAASNPGEYWAEIAQSFFDCNRVNNWNHGPIGTREQLAAYDPDGYKLVRDAFRLTPETDWRYRWLQRLPNVTPPPARFGLDPWYTRFTWAREFPIVGRGASGAAMLAANETVRKLFAYRHDILKALIADGVKLVVLGPGESLADLPEFRANPDAFDPLLRVHDYDSKSKTLVVAEADVLADPAEPDRLPNPVIAVMARAIHEVAGKRPVVPESDTPRRNLQQYELRVKRLDVTFDERLKTLHEQALAAGKWRGTRAVHSTADYWCAGVLAYFDAIGQEAAPADAPHPITRRERLAAYDPDLYDLVRETMAYEGHVDWRFTQARP
jgi:hypothetical protein